MYAVIRAGGKQYRVAPGDVIRVEKLGTGTDEQVEFPVLAVSGEAGQVSQQADARVTGHVVEEGRGAKILVPGVDQVLGADELRRAGRGSSRARAPGRSGRAPRRGSPGTDSGASGARRATDVPAARAWRTACWIEPHVLPHPSTSSLAPSGSSTSTGGMSFAIRPPSRRGCGPCARGCPGRSSTFPVPSCFSMPPMRCIRPGVPGIAHGRASVTGSRRYGQNSPSWFGSVANVTDRSGSASTSGSSHGSEPFAR